MASEIRMNPFSGMDVIIENSGNKIEEFFSSDNLLQKKYPTCPFCERNEDKTPPEIVAWRDSSTGPDSPGWKVRTVPNRYPVLQIERKKNWRGVDMYDQMNGMGADEIIINTPHHELTFDNLSVIQLKDVLWMMRHRVADLQKDPRFKYILVFDHEGSDIDHSHLHVYGFPFVIPRIRQELDYAQAYYTHKKRCIYCDALKNEIREGNRLVDENGSFLSFQPFAARQTFETWILPYEHSSDFGDLKDKELKDLAQILGTFWFRLRKILGNNISFRFALHTSPNPNSFQLVNNPWPHLSHFYHWHLEIRPWTKLEKTSFESATGVYQNPVPPETSAGWLREAI